MEQRAGGGHVDPVGQAEQGAERAQGPLQVVHPDVAAVDDPRHQPLARQPGDGGEAVEVRGGRAGEVEGEPVDGGLGQDGEGVAESVEVGGDQEFGPVGERAQLAVGAGGGVQFGGRAVLDQGGLVELRPLGAGGPQVGEDPRVDGQQPVEQGERVEVGGDAGGGLGQQEVGDGARDDRAGCEPEPEGFPQLFDLLGGVGGEDRVRPQLGYQVVVVGVEPLGHLQRRHVLGAAGHGEVPVQRVGVHGRAVPLGDRADHDGGVEHVVVVREVAGGHLADAGGGQLLPVAAAQSRGGGAQPVGVDAALPVALDRLLELPALALPG